MYTVIYFKEQHGLLNLFQFLSTVGTMLILVNIIIITSNGFIIPALASDLTIDDLISLQDPVQDKVIFVIFQMAIVQKRTT